MAFGVLTSSAPPPTTPTPPALAAGAEIALFGPGVESGDFDPDAIRRTLRDFVDSMGPLERAKAYYEDASLQPAQWELCTIVQQCPVPKYGLALGSFAPVMRTHFFGALALALSDESYKRILVQELPTCSSERCRRGRSRAPARAPS